MSELEFKKTGIGKNAGFVIKDKDGKGFGSIKNKPSADKLGNKVELRTNKPIPQSIRKQIQNERIKKGLLSPGQIKLAEKFAADEKKPVHRMPVKNMTEAKKMALKISKVGGGGDFPIKIEQGPDLVKDKKKFSSGGIVNFKGQF